MNGVILVAPMNTGNSYGVESVERRGIRKSLGRQSALGVDAKGGRGLRSHIKVVPTRKVS